MNLEKIQVLGAILDQFRKTERNAFAVGLERKENDSEHSFELTLMCWFLALEYNKSWGCLDINKVLQYALIHDLVEVYAGDTDTYSWPKELSDSKHARETEALHILEEKLSFFPELIHAIQTYEMQQDEEAQFVKWVDKSSFPLAQIRDNYRSRKHLHSTLSLQDVDEEKQKKTKHPFGKLLWNSIRNYIIDTLWRDKTKRFGDFL